LDCGGKLDDIFPALHLLDGYFGFMKRAFHGIGLFDRFFQNVRPAEKRLTSFADLNGRIALKDIDWQIGRFGIPDLLRFFPVITLGGDEQIGLF